MRRRLAVVAFVVLLAGCGGSGSGVAPGHGATASTENGPRANATLKIVFPKHFAVARSGRTRGTSAVKRAPASTTRKAAYVNPSSSNILAFTVDYQTTTNYQLSLQTPAADGSLTFTVALPVGSHSLIANEYDAQNDLLAGGSTYVTISPGSSNALTITMNMNATRVALTTDAAEGGDAVAFSQNGTGLMCVAPSLTPQLYAFAADQSNGFVLPGTATGNSTIPTPALVSQSSANGGTSRLIATINGFKPVFDGQNDDIRATFAVNNPYDGGTYDATVSIGTGSSASCVPAFKQFPTNSGAGQIIVGPDQKLYFTLNGYIGSLDPLATSLSVATYAVPSSWTPYGNALAFKGQTLWVDLVVLATTYTAVTTLPLPSTIVSNPVNTGSTFTTFGLTVGGDGRIYVGLDDQLGGTNYILPIETDGTQDAKIAIGMGGTGGPNAPAQLVTGADGNIYFPFVQPNGIGKLTNLTNGGTFSVLNSSLQGRAYGPTVAADGSIWFGEEGPTSPAYIGKVTPSGTLTEYPVNGLPGGIYAVTFGPDGYVWFTGNGGVLGRMSTSGTVTNIWNLPNGADPESLVFGPDRNLWVTDVTSNQLVQVTSPY